MKNAPSLALVALGLAWRFGPKPRRTIFWGETAYVALAALLALLVNGLLLNPWLGEAPAPAPGVTIYNLLLLGYGAPAAVLAAYAILKRSQGAIRRATLAGGLGSLTADFGSFSAMPSISSRRSISRQTSSGVMPQAAHSTARL